MEQERDVPTRGEDKNNWVTRSSKVGITPVWSDMGKRARDVMGSEP